MSLLLPFWGPGGCLVGMEGEGGSFSGNEMART